MFQRRRKGDILEVKVSDVCREVFYKERANVLDKKQVAQILNGLKKCGIDVEEIVIDYIPFINEMEQMELEKQGKVWH